MTPNGASAIIYTLKATVTRQAGFGVFGGKWSAKRSINIIRGLLPEAAEYTQTLEIENTWPGKIMYNITLPHKAYCAGELVPVSVSVYFVPTERADKSVVEPLSSHRWQKA